MNGTCMHDVLEVMKGSGGRYELKLTMMGWDNINNNGLDRL
jgi:hypothetical protein